MMGYVESPRAWSYARGMARTVGVSLPDAVVEGWLSRGELALIVETDRPCDAVAVEPAKLLSVPRTVFRKMLEEFPNIARDMKNRLTGKLRRDSTFASDDHRNFNRYGQSFDVGETFSGVDYDTVEG